MKAPSQMKTDYTQRRSRGGHLPPGARGRGAPKSVFPAAKGAAPGGGGAAKRVCPRAHSTIDTPLIIRHCLASPSLPGFVGKLQEALASDNLATGLYREVPAAAETKFINNKAGLQQKLDEIRQKIDWTETLDLVCEPAKAIAGETATHDTGEAANDDFKRELLFYRQAQTAVLVGLPRLQSEGMPTKRPEDYFAEMVKSDEHMKKVREKILAKQVSVDLSEKAKKLREMRKFGKRLKHKKNARPGKSKRQKTKSLKR